MVFESLIGVKFAERKPLHVFLLGLVYATVAVFLSLWIFRTEASLVMVFLTVMASIPLVYATLKYEAKRDLVIKDEARILKGHMYGLRLFIFLFLGYVTALVFWYLALPAELVYDLFAVQISTIQAINGNANLVPAAISNWSYLSMIVGNNLKVLFFCIFFSFFYGAGAIFILTWNASVISAAMGAFFRNNIGAYASSVGFTKVAGYFHIISLSILRYMTHGVFEILAYFVAGLAGGLISLGILHFKVKDDRFKILMKDAANLVILAIIVLLFAGLIEVYVTPLLF